MGRTNEEMSTARNRTDEILQHYAAIIESSDDAIIGKTLDGIITSWNLGAETIFGYTAQEMMGKSVLVLFPSERVNEEAEILQRIAHGERIHHYETMRVRKDGKRIDVSVTISPVIDASGKIVGASKIARDISERNQSQEALRDAQNRYKATLDQLLEGCQIIGYDWRYIYANDVAARHGNRTKEELLGHTMMEVYPGIETTQMFRHLVRCMEERVPYRMENEFVFEDGTAGWFNLNIAPVDEGIFILSEDVTERRRMLEEVHKHREHLEELVKERTSQLEEANRELEAFSYSVSHDLRAPLRHINGFVEILLRRASSSLDDENRRYLQIISSSAVEMGNLIDNLLDLSRMGRTELVKRKTDVDALVREVIASMSREINGRTIDWKISPLPEVEADPLMLRLVFVNLLSNAVKYTRTREKAEIHVRHIRDEREDTFAVQDNGVGFDMRYKDKLFGVFQRLHSQDEFEGIGIGLANVRRIIRRHGGRTWAEGKVDGGATFYFSLPSVHKGEQP